ncbi:MAG TPA: Holliday junction branch migration protein RuvA [Nitrospirota bacterium]|nr:Holliday junction branch migration protein RuvA [Nitrospirota bacterium]
MIASIRGRLRRKGTDYLIVDVAGIGYQVQVPLSTYYSIPDDGEEVSLHIHTHMREDSLSLFGFLTQEEKEMFLLLIGVSGIGTKLALSILSSLSVPDISLAIQASDDSRLRSIPGIGKKTAARMVLELKDKVKLIAPAAASMQGQTTPAPSGDVEDAVSALVNLGYKRPLAQEALNKIHQKSPGLTVQELIREALQILMRR